jgi:WD40 repeat protein
LRSSRLNKHRPNRSLLLELKVVITTVEIRFAFFLSRIHRSMSTVFLSHASKDDSIASELERWLRANGVTDLFVDHTSIKVGSNWADALRAAAGNCRVVILLVTEHWLNSPQCPGEFRAAWYMGKKIVPLFLLDNSVSRTQSAAEELKRVRAENQGIDLRSVVDENGHLNFRANEMQANSLREGLLALGAFSEAGLDPEVFEIDKVQRPSPFPGLSSFGDKESDAAIFFGRAREIAETLEIVRGMRSVPKGKALVILGASGAGKSSLMKAGLFPRLRREAPAWIVLPVFRSGADPTFNFCLSYSNALYSFDEHADAGTLAQQLQSDGNKISTEPFMLSQAIEQMADRLRLVAGRPKATILIGIDQAEDLLLCAQTKSRLFADCLRIMLRSESPWHVVLTARTNSFAELQSSDILEGIETRGYDLRGLPLFQFDNIIVSPAKRYNLNLSPELVDALVSDAPKEDTLPILAFAIERLWKRSAGKGELTVADYDALGGLPTLIEDAAERALARISPTDGDVPVASNRISNTDEKLAIRTFMPALADISEQGLPIRRTAEWKRFDAEQQDLLQRFDVWRLIVRKGNVQGEETVEFAHDAIFRAWSRLDRWLAPERSNLVRLRDLKLSATAWMRGGKRPIHCTHFGSQLREAERLIRDLRYDKQIDSIDKDYVVECRRNVSRKIRRGSFIAATVIIFAITSNEWIYRKNLLSEADSAIRSGHAMRGAVLAVASSMSHSVVSAILGAEATRLLRDAGLASNLIADLGPNHDHLDSYENSDRLFVAGLGGTGSVVDAETGKKILDFPVRGWLDDHVPSQDGRWLVTRNDLTATVWDAQTGKRLQDFSGVATIEKLPEVDRALLRMVDGRLMLVDLVELRTRAEVGLVGDSVRIGFPKKPAPRFITVTAADHLMIWDAISGQRVGGSDLDGACVYCYISEGGTSVVTFNKDGVISVFDGMTGGFLRELERVIIPDSMQLSADGTRFAGKSKTGAIAIWDTTTGVAIAQRNLGASSLELSPGGRLALLKTPGKAGSIWRLSDGKLLREISEGGLDGYVFSTDDTRLITSTNNDTGYLYELLNYTPPVQLGEVGAARGTYLTSKGNFAVTSSATAPMTLWDLRDTSNLHKIREIGPPTVQNELTMSKDESTIIFSADDDVGVVLDTQTGSHKGLLGGPGTVRWIKFTATEDAIITESSTNQALLWQRPDLVAQPENRNLREVVCSKYREEIGNAANGVERDYASLWSGRPRNPCDWKGLGTLLGWWQSLLHLLSLMNFVK